MAIARFTLLSFFRYSLSMSFRYIIILLLALGLSFPAYAAPKKHGKPTAGKTRASATSKVAKAHHGGKPGKTTKGTKTAKAGRGGKKSRHHAAERPPSAATLAKRKENVEVVKAGLPSTDISTQDLIVQSLNLVGVKYRYGGKSPETGLDCSGLVRYVFKQSLEMALPHNAASISKLGKVIEKTDLQPGDLVFFNTLRRDYSHVGIYLGDNRFIHAPRAGQKVQVVDMNDRYWQDRFNGARRLLKGPVDEAQIKAEAEKLQGLTGPADAATGATGAAATTPPAATAGPPENGH